MEVTGATVKTCGEIVLRTGPSRELAAGSARGRRVPAAVPR
jgi:hypothetical protein